MPTFKEPEVVNSELSLAMFWLSRKGNDVLWMPERQCWYRWSNESGWMANSDEECLGEVQRIASSFFKRRASTGDWVPHPTLGGKYSTAVGGLKSARPYVLTSINEWDSNPEVIGAANGNVINLRTREVRKMVRADRIGLRVPVLPDFDVPEDSKWRRFLNETFPDPIMQEYVLRLSGYTLTGYMREHVIPFLYGQKRMGKSTYFNAIRSAMGDYAEVSLASNYQRGAGVHKTFYAKLRNAHGVFLTEIPRGFQLDEGLVKSMTGGEPLEANYMRGDSFTFDPKFSLWLIGNNAPTMSERDGGLLERIKVIEFKHKPERKDRKLPEVLQGEEQRFVLADLVTQAAEYLAGGIGVEPGEVLESGQSYADMADTLSVFLLEVVEPAPLDEYIDRTTLFAAYREWVEDAKQRNPYGKTGFLRVLREGDYQVGGQRFAEMRQKDGTYGYAGGRIKSKHEWRVPWWHQET